MLTTRWGTARFWYILQPVKSTWVDAIYIQKVTTYLLKGFPDSHCSLINICTLFIIPFEPRLHLDLHDSISIVGFLQLEKYKKISSIWQIHVSSHPGKLIFATWTCLIATLGLHEHVDFHCGLIPHCEFETSSICNCGEKPDAHEMRNVRCARWTDAWTSKQTHTHTTLTHTSLLYVHRVLSSRSLGILLNTQMLCLNKSSTELIEFAKFLF